MPDRPPGESGGSPPQVTPYQIWVLLRNSGFTFNEAAGIMGNMISESGLNPEAVQSGTSNPGYGLVQWEASSYPSAPSLVTGNPVQDANAQITFLAQTGGKQAASGATPAEAGSNFAQNYEKCAECGPGGSQTSARASQATAVAGWATANKWPSNLGSAVQTAGAGSGSGSNAAACLVSAPSVDLWVTSIGGGCLLGKPQARAVMGALVLTAGTGIMALGVIILVAAGFAKSGVAQKAADAAAVVPGGQGVAAGLSAVHAASTRTGSQARAQRGAERRARASETEHEGRQFDQVMARNRDSRKGRAPREREREEAPF